MFCAYNIQDSRNEFHFSEVYRSVNYTGSKCKLHRIACKRRNLVYTSINIRNCKFIAYIYIHLNQNLVKKTYMSAKIEAVKHLHAAPTSNQIEESHGLSLRH